MKNWNAIFPACLLSLLLSMTSACTSTGTGGGQLQVSEGQETPVTFSWISTDGGISGTMTAALPDAIYTGRFFQITVQTRAEVLTPLWTHWRPGWHDWPYWGYRGFPYESTYFTTYYSGKVVAILESGTNSRMRCRFHLVDPTRGMNGGGEGECQLTDGKTLRADFRAN